MRPDDTNPACCVCGGLPNFWFVDGPAYCARHFPDGGYEIVQEPREPQAAWESDPDGWKEAP